MGKLIHVVLFNGYSLLQHPRIAGHVSTAPGVKAGPYYSDWEHVCLGTKEQPGRIPAAIALARELNADCLIWSTGATWLGTISEARYCFEQAFGDDRYSPYLYEDEEDWLRRISFIEEKSTNTATTMVEVKKILRDKFPDKEIMLHPISSANHMPRVVRDMNAAFADMPNVHFPWARTSYGGKTPADVVIYELGEPTRQI